METKEPQKVRYHENKNRIFVRGIQGEYNLTEELKRLRSLPRVVRGRENHFIEGPQAYSKHYMEPKDGMGQTLHIHLEEYGPGGKSQKHGHVNEAVFYILDGIGAEEHDGVRYEWEAGDVAIVHNNCVHQHFNRSDTKPARALVLKTKPMYLFINMLFQKTLELRPSGPAPGGEGFVPRDEPEELFQTALAWAHDHDHDHHDHDHAHEHAREHQH
jgi:quercetin dioxygenase-like cupin family protein